MTRREFLSRSSAVLATLLVGACASRMPVRPVYRSLIPDDTSATFVNDVHSQLNATRVAAIATKERRGDRRYRFRIALV